MLLAFEDVVVDLPDGEDPDDEYHFPLTFTWALPPLPHGPDLLRLAIDLAGVGGVELPLESSAIDSYASATDPGRAAHHHRGSPAGLPGPGPGWRGTAVRDLRQGAGGQPVPARAGAGLADAVADVSAPAGLPAWRSSRPGVASS